MTSPRSVLLAAAAVVLSACGGQPLQPWHTANLTNEYTVKNSAEIQTFADYLALEDRLFDELQTDVYAEVGTGPEYAIVRYSSGSAADPTTHETNWNRTFEMPAETPRGGILLLHGLTDSPYTLHDFGEDLNEKGYWIVGLRIPGHGTVPAALKTTRWQDMAAAVRMAFNYLSEKIGDQRVHIIGYSTGATLALDLALDSLDDDAIKTPASLVLISPAIGVSAAAALARPTAAVSRVPGLGRVAWTQTTPEFDPYKYNSFPTNAGAQVHNLTRSVSSRIGRLAAAGNAEAMPPILVFKSAVDATVSTNAVVDRLLGRLPDNGNELVLFDINRAVWTSVLLIADPAPLTNRLVNDASLPFTLTLIANENNESTSVVAHSKTPYTEEFTSTEQLNLEWPQGVISLSHVALPFAPSDKLYGRYPPEDRSSLFLGQMEIRGERGLLTISSDWLLRIRYNPFYDVIEKRILDWVTIYGS